jgi:hypothetical protein
MIEPTEQDIGRAVVYTGNRYPGGKLEEGVITSFNDYRVFVRYGADLHSKATSRADLDWMRPNTSGEQLTTWGGFKCERVDKLSDR